MGEEAKHQEVDSDPMFVLCGLAVGLNKHYSWNGAAGRFFCRVSRH